MEFEDWLNCLPYDRKMNMEEMLKIGKDLGLSLDREESDLLINFLADDFTPSPTRDQIKVECNRSGIWIRG